MALRARNRLGVAKPRQTVPGDESARLTAAFLSATETGDEAGLRALLAAHAVVHTDGGGMRPAALNLIHGAEKAARMFARLAAKKGAAPPLLYRERINGLPGYVTLEPDGLPQTTALEMAEGRITAVYITRNPQKLRAISAALGLALQAP